MLRLWAGEEMKLQCNKAYIVFAIVKSGITHQGLRVTRGNSKTVQRPKDYWFAVDAEKELTDQAAQLIRHALDRGYARPQVQAGLFEGLFADQAPPDDPLLARAHDQALTLPSSLSWKQTFLASAQPCHQCAVLIKTRTPAYMATANTPAGCVVHIHCRSCFTQPQAHQTEPADMPLFAVGG